MQYDDGYVAYLNGVEVARRNAPTTVTWNSQAVAERTSDVQCTTFENVDVTSFLNSGTTGHLLATGNVLAIQVMKSSLAEGDMLVVPELSQIVTTQMGNHFFNTPTPARRTRSTLGSPTSRLASNMDSSTSRSSWQSRRRPPVPTSTIRWTVPRRAPRTGRITPGRLRLAQRRRCARFL